MCLQSVPIIFLSSVFFIFIFLILKLILVKSLSNFGVFCLLFSFFFYMSIDFFFSCKLMFI